MTKREEIVARAKAAAAKALAPKANATSLGSQRVRAVAAKVLATKPGAPTLSNELRERLAACELELTRLAGALGVSIAEGTGYRRDIEALRQELARAVWQKGDKGDPGLVGPAGASVTGPAGPEGPRGPDGARGPAGESIVGPEGPVGSRGASAYEVAVAEGYKGTAEAWLKTLVGPEGKPGPAGKDSTVPGPQGEPGLQGKQGPIGPRGLGPVAQPESARAKAQPAPGGGLPALVACPECGLEQDLQVALGADFGRVASVTTVCQGCSAQFDVDGAGVYLRCRSCGHRDSQGHICG